MMLMSDKPDKPLLILDLDETLFHTTYDHEAITRRHGVRPDFSFEGQYHTFKRPGVHRQRIGGVASGGMDERHARLRTVHERAHLR